MDENYILESLMKPQAKIVAGFPATMPTFQGLLREREINALIALIRGPEAAATESQDGRQDDPPDHEEGGDKPTPSGAE